MGSPRLSGIISPTIKENGHNYNGVTTIKWVFPPSIKGIE